MFTGGTGKSRNKETRNETKRNEISRLKGQKTWGICTCAPSLMVLIAISIGSVQLYKDAAGKGPEVALQLA